MTTNTVELKIATPLILKKDKETGEAIKTKTIYTRRWLKINKLEGPYAITKKNGAEYKSICAVNHEDLGFLEIKGSYEQTKEKLGRIVVKGFMGRRL